MMLFFLALVALSGFSICIALWYLGAKIYEQRLAAFGGLGAIEERLGLLSGHVNRLVDVTVSKQPADDVRVELARMHAVVESNKILVADGLEKITSLAARTATRQAREKKHDDLEDDDPQDDFFMSPADKRRAMAAIAGAGGDSEAPKPTGPGHAHNNTGDASGWDRVRSIASQGE